MAKKCARCGEILVPAEKGTVPGDVEICVNCTYTKFVEILDSKPVKTTTRKGRK